MSALERYEYPSPAELDPDAGVYFAVPSRIILNKDMGDKRMTAFSFFSIRRGLDCGVSFSINGLVEWVGRKPDRHSNGINGKFANAIECLESEGYVSLSDKVKNSACIEACFNLDKVSQECRHDRFAIIYLDELKKILNYRNPNSKDTLLNNDNILLLFAYLRMMIFRRRNKLLPEEMNLDNRCSHEYDVDMRRRKSPDAYNGYFCDIADDLGMPARTVSKAVAVLNDLGLIYSEQLPRTKHNGKWTTNHTVFCNC